MLKSPPLRITTGEVLPSRAPTFGWFPRVSARVSLWYGGKHVDDVSTFTGVGYAIEEGERLCEYYGIKPDSPMVVAVCVTETEEPMVRRADGGWDHPSRGVQVPKDITTRQYLAWTSARGAIDQAAEYQPVKLRFAQRFTAQGPEAGTPDLTPFFRGSVELFTDANLMIGVAHAGLTIEGLSIVNLGATPAPGVFQVEATGALTMLARDPRAMKEFGSPRLYCLPNGDRVYWDTNGNGYAQWETLP